MQLRTGQADYLAGFQSRQIGIQRIQLVGAQSFDLGTGQAAELGTIQHIQLVGLHVAQLGGRQCADLCARQVLQRIGGQSAHLRGGQCGDLAGFQAAQTVVQRIQLICGQGLDLGGRQGLQLTGCQARHVISTQTLQLRTGQADYLAGFQSGEMSIYSI